MKSVKMPTLSTHIRTSRGKERIVVPGAWTAHVPEIESVDGETRLRYTRYWQADGLPPAAAERRALATVQGALEHGFLRGLQHSIRRYARIYAQRFPALRTPEGVLRGFDPALMQSAFCPHENVGRAGKAFVDELFARMAQSAEESK